MWTGLYLCLFQRLTEEIEGRRPAKHLGHVTGDYVAENDSNLST